MEGSRIMNLTYIAFGISLVLTVWHLAEEYFGELWVYFGNIAGVDIPKWLGISVFTGLLGVALFVAALGILDLNGNGDFRSFSLVGIGFLIGARLSDWWNSHVRLQRNFRLNRDIPAILDCFQRGFTRPMPHCSLRCLAFTMRGGWPIHPGRHC